VVQLGHTNHNTSGGESCSTSPQCLHPGTGLIQWASRTNWYPVQSLFNSVWEHTRGHGYNVSACVPLTWWAGCLPQRAHTHTQHVRQEWTGSNRCHHHDSPPESQDYPKRRKHQQMIPSRTTECLSHHSSNVWITKKDNSGSSSSTTAVWTIAVPTGIGQLNPHSILTCSSRRLSVEVQFLRFTMY